MPCLGFFRLSYSDTAEMEPLTQMRQAASPIHAKKIHGAALGSPDKQMTLLPRTTRLQLPSLLFLQGRPWFWGLPLTLCALANLLVFLEAFVGSTSEAEKILQTSKQSSSNSWEIGAGTQIKHIWRSGNDSHSFNS